jgi:hypothetical protein
MKGIELSRLFYLEHGKRMLHDEFSDIENLLAIGIAGSGSECFGYDDELSQDHDFEAGFCIFLPDEDTVNRRREFELERAYSRLPKEYCGYKRSIVSPVGGSRHGVIRMSEFFKAKTGSADGELSMRDWLFLPEQSISEAVNGEIFRDDFGRFTMIRERLSYMPEDVRLKKLSGNLLIMGQSGQYNYKRCITRGESGAAQLAVFEFAKSAINAVFLINKHYAPYYKWSFKALRSVNLLSELATPIEYLISSDNSPSNVATKLNEIERVCEAITSMACELSLSNYNGTEAEGHAYSVNDAIADPELRNLHILIGVE